jgi:bifunctional non-homologous end joining protein LigD
MNNRFVVQKHNASHLHYDFRLEMEDVLKSWAVPKGPSLDPADKRLSIQVGDHSLSYFDFEGVIREGYGAGSVMVWDLGTWEPLTNLSSQKDKYNMLVAGRMKFHLHGTKLNGEFSFTRIRPKNWLLIKKHDEFAVSGYDIEAESLSKSALTQHTMDEVVATGKYLTNECGE